MPDKNTILKKITLYLTKFLTYKKNIDNLDKSPPFNKLSPPLNIDSQTVHLIYFETVNDQRVHDAILIKISWQRWTATKQTLV